MRIALTGNPNSGKTTMYNALTGRNEKVGNWAGVTVEKKEHPIKKAYSSFEGTLVAVDLPGAYSMSPFTSEESITSSYVRNEHPDVIINMDDQTGKFEVFLKKTVVEEVVDPGTEVSLERARKISPTIEIGGAVGMRLDTKQFGRIAAQTAKQVIGIRDGERGQMMQEFQSKQQELVTAVVERIDPETGAATLRFGKAEAVLPRKEQVGDENLKEGDHIKVYVVSVKESEKGPRAIISRTHPDLVKRLFETEVPEIYDGTVEIKAVAREAGSRTKLAVISHNPDVDAVGACIGARGARVSNIVTELGGAARKSISWSTATSRRSLLLPPCLPQRSCLWKWHRMAPMPAASPFPTDSFPWPSATRARMPVWRLI